MIQPPARPGPLKRLGDVIQIAYFPTDFDAAMQYWIETVGVGPFFVLNDVRLDEMTYRGEPTDAVFSMAIGYWGDIQIELIKTDSTAPSLYHGEYAVRDSVHHVCVFVPDIEEARRACIEAGAEIIVAGKVGADGAVIYVEEITLGPDLFRVSLRVAGLTVEPLDSVDTLS